MLLTLALGKNNESFNSLLYLKITVLVAALTRAGVQTARLERLCLGCVGVLYPFIRCAETHGLCKSWVGKKCMRGKGSSRSVSGYKDKGTILPLATV